MDEKTARERLIAGLYWINTNKPDRDRWWDYYQGEQDKPFAPHGVDQEYLQLREMAIAPWLDLVTGTAVQRLIVDGFRTHRGGKDDADADAQVWSWWQANRLDGRQSMVYVDRKVFGHGLVSVWTGAPGAQAPVIRPESPRRCHVEPDPDDPFRPLWVVKTWESATRVAYPLAVESRAVHHAVVYDSTGFVRFVKEPGAASWELVRDGTHGLGQPPFVIFPNRQDSEGKTYSDIARLIPLQDAINTTRFNLMLAMQYAAFRQRAVFGFDPVVRDDNGDPVWEQDADGNPVLHPKTGQPMPRLNSMPRAGVDRTWVFPGADTTMQEFSESNLANYTGAQAAHVEHLAALSQTPPHYLLGQLINLSAEALTAAETTLTRLVLRDQVTDGEAWEDVMRLANRAMGTGELDLSSQTAWRNTESVSLAQVVDAINKMVGGPVLSPESGRELIPGATPQDLQRWKESFEAHANDVASRLMLGDVAGVLTGPKPALADTSTVPATGEHQDAASGATAA